jgi:hypothetical protein
VVDAKTGRADRAGNAINEVGTARGARASRNDVVAESAGQGQCAVDDFDVVVLRRRRIVIIAVVIHFGLLGFGNTVLPYTEYEASGSVLQEPDAIYL